MGFQALEALKGFQETGLLALFVLKIKIGPVVAPAITD